MSPDHIVSFPTPAEARSPAPDGVNGPTGLVPVMETIDLRKYFPVRRLSPLAPRQVVHAVEAMSLALYPGRALALVGESGSGKTTVARLLARLYEPTSGSIRFQGEPVEDHSRSAMVAYRRHVQLIFQDPFSSLNPVHDVRYHLSRPLRIHGHARTRAQETEQVRALLNKVNLTPASQFIGKLPHQLSGGQRQRVAIARALAVQPDVLLADEPVSMLDVSIRLDVLNLLLRLKDEERLAVLFITHDIASARYFAEDTLVMYAGQAVEGGPSDAVIRQPKHPYTQLLISAAPDTSRPADAPFVGRGDIPSLITPPSGCRFHPRCPHVMPVCRERFPGRTELGGGHWTHCFLYGEGEYGEGERHSVAIGQSDGTRVGASGGRPLAASDGTRVGASGRRPLAASGGTRVGASGRRPLAASGGIPENSARPATPRQAPGR